MRFMVINSATKDFKQIIKTAKTNKKILVAQVAPAVRVAIGEPFECVAKPKQIVTSLKQLGFDYVFDTTFSADVTIMEEGTEFLKRYNSGKLPLMTSCCPGWIQLVENSYPELKPYISTTKSPQQIMGSLVKNYFSKIIDKNAEDLYHVSVMPCVRKQSEADKIGDVDIVITTNDLVDWLKENNIDFCNLEETEFDHPMGEGTGGGIIFGRTGGVMLAALRYVYRTLTGETLEDVELTSNKIIPSVKEATLYIPIESNTVLMIDIAIVVGLGDAKKYVKAMKDGTIKHHFIEVMACVPVGCASGGGSYACHRQQPNVGKNKEILEKRKDLLNQLDDESVSKVCDENTSLQKLYKEYLGKPYEGIANDLLHLH